MFIGVESDRTNERTKGKTMKVKNAISKLNKAGFITETVTGVAGAITGYYARKSSCKNCVSFRRNGRTEDVTCIRVMHCNDQDEMQSDYVAGVFVDNISRAIRLARC